MYVAIFAVLFSASCLLCCFGRFRFFVALFALLRLCLTLHMQCLGEAPACYVRFVFFCALARRIWWCCFCSCCPSPRYTSKMWVIRAHASTPVPTSRVPLHQIPPLGASKPFADIGELLILCVCFLLWVCIILVIVFVFVCVARAF